MARNNGEGQKKQPRKGKKPGTALVPVGVPRSKALVAIAQPEKRKPGRKPSGNYVKVDGEVCLKILAHFADGLSIRKACKRERARRKDLYDFLALNPEMAKARDQARVTHYYNRVDEMHEIARTELDVNRARLRVHAIQWEASRVAKDIYGDRQQLEHSGGINHRVTGMTELLADISQEADTGVGPARSRVN